jgi:hypoxanthine phosphoribosyltransferase
MRLKYQPGCDRPPVLAAARSMSSPSGKNCNTTVRSFPERRPRVIRRSASTFQGRGQRVLIVDEVWDTGTTIQAVIDRVRIAGGRPTTAVLHYKPGRSRVPAVPDCYVVATDAWVVYPFKTGR